MFETSSEGVLSISGELWERFLARIRNSTSTLSRRASLITHSTPSQILASEKETLLARAYGLVSANAEEGLRTVRGLSKSWRPFSRHSYSAGNLRAILQECLAHMIKTIVLAVLRGFPAVTPVWTHISASRVMIYLNAPADLSVIRYLYRLERQGHLTTTLHISDGRSSRASLDGGRFIGSSSAILYEIRVGLPSDVPTLIRMVRSTPDLARAIRKITQSLSRKLTVPTDTWGVPSAYAVQSTKLLASAMSVTSFMEADYPTAIRQARALNARFNSLPSHERSAYVSYEMQSATGDGESFMWKRT